jgi:hypothetical protein
MPATLRRLSLEQCTTLIASGVPSLERKITSIHLHHTWRPTQSQFRGQATLDAIRNYHVTHNRWDDIAQHLTIDPHGFAWTGRNWNLPPASQAGKNGTRQEGPFMIELIGDFDAGRDVLDGTQRESAIQIVAALLGAADLGSDALFFHRDLGWPKSCPGRGVDKQALIDAVQAVLDSRSRRAAAPAKKDKSRAQLPFDKRYVLGHEVTEPAGKPAAGYESWQVPENEHAAGFVQDDARARVQIALGHTREMAAVLERTENKWLPLEPHVVNLTKGRLSQGGQFDMPPGAIERIIDAIRQYASTVSQPRVMMHAHGGLVGETKALEYALAAHTWWLAHGVYPIYFIWETSVWEVIKQRLGLARELPGLGELRDRGFERLARLAGKPLWSDMKESALRASSVDAGDGDPGGALTFAEALASLVRSRPGGQTITLHAVGHSAGAIFHAHLLPRLVEHGVTIDSLALLAPAVRIDLFNAMLVPHITGGTIQRFEMYTMDEEAERDDDLIDVFSLPLYGKSLLYLISGAFEPEEEKAAILGLEERFKKDATVMGLFPMHRLELSHARGKPHNPATASRKHGCFDNDAATLESILKSISGAAAGIPFPVDADCERAAQRAIIGLPSMVPAFGRAIAAPMVLDTSRNGAGGSRRAICVGIDGYVQSPLAGCVRDAQMWAQTLRGLGFDVTTVLDREATRQQILDALRVLVESARAGDRLVFQYAGHGTQAEDLNGDESDRYDEALVPVDYHTGALLLDDDLADVYRRLPDGAVLTLFMDCCHSGTNSRFAPIDRSQARGSEGRRFLALTPEVEAAHRRFRAVRGSPPPTTAEESLPGVVHFAACLDNQYAYESDGQGHFTRVAARALAAAVAGESTNEVFANDVTAKVIALGRPQTPRLMRLPAALTGRPLLGATLESSVQSNPTAVPSTDRAWAEWCLQFFEAGAAHWRQQLGR